MSPYDYHTQKKMLLTLLPTILFMKRIFQDGKFVSSLFYFCKWECQQMAKSEEPLSHLSAAFLLTINKSSLNI
jgi:hypothetical protein